MTDSTTASAAPASNRLASIDVYRGLVMFLMMAEALHFGKVAESQPGNRFWMFLDHQQSHVEWIGCVLHDLIQPSFSFLVGTAMAFSIASRKARSQSFLQLLGHALWRSFALSALGIFLRSIGHPMTRFTFEDTLTQIGLGYTFLFLLSTCKIRTQWIALGAILGGYWLAFVLYPLPPAGFDLKSVGVPNDWPHLMSGFSAHWNKNSNLAWAFDTWFLNLFPREASFVYNGGGYSTLSFLPTLGTMLLGLFAGRWLQSIPAPSDRIKRLILAGVIGLAAGWALNATGLCPNVKRIWTPSWTLFSGGWCFLLLSAFYAVVDVWNHRRWAFPLMVVGMNSIAAYMMDHLFSGFIRKALDRHLSSHIFNLFGTSYIPLVQGALLLLILWLILYWMYRRKLFLRL